MCAAPTKLNQEQCQAILVRRAEKASGLRPAATTPVPGAYMATDLQSAYDLAAEAATNGKGVTVSIVDAYRDPGIVADLATYRAQNSLPACDTTTGAGCLSTYSETGGSVSSVPVDTTGGWEFEQSLDVDMVSAICPLCHIALYETNSNSTSDLGTAENTAAASSKFVSNSWSGFDEPGESYYDTAYFNHPGVVTAFASGDIGYGAGYPASSELVTSVGGTYLTKDSTTTRGWSETVWNDATGATGSGCSSGEPKPVWQTDPGCANRTENDVSAVADGPNGISVYDSYVPKGSSSSNVNCGGWCAGAGTSVATPIVTSVYALANSGTTGGSPAARTYPSQYLYQGNGAGLNRVTTGNNWPASQYKCESTRQYLCDAASSLSSGYNGPTGWGTPNGANLSAFTDTSTTAQISAVNPGTVDIESGIDYTPLVSNIPAYDSATSTPSLTYTATGLPSGMTMDSATGAISGTAAAGTSTVQVAISDGTASTTISFQIVAVASLDTGFHPSGGPVRLDLGGKCMDDENNSSANLNKVQIWNCNGAASQSWTYYPDTNPGGGGIFVHNGKCLDIHRGGTSNGTTLDLYTCNGTGSQQWYLIGSAGELYNYQSGRCAEDPYGSTTNGRQLDIWDCNGNNNQAWTPAASPVQSGITGMCMDDRNNSNASGNPIQLYTCNGLAGQKWTLGLNGSLQIDGKCLDASGYGTTDGTALQLWTCNTNVNTNGNQLWVMTGTGEIENVNAEKCLAVPGNATASGTQLELEDCTGQPGEVWAQS